jgi:hypothetical protein
MGAMEKKMSSFLLTKYSIVIILVSLLRSLLVRSSFGNYTIVLFVILLFIFFVNYTIVLFGILFGIDPAFLCALIPIKSYSNAERPLRRES